MLHLRLSDIKAKIIAQAALSEDELNTRMQQKMQALAGLISEEGAAHIVANELGVKLFDPANLKVKDVLVGMRSIDLCGKVMRKFEERTFQSGGREGRVANFVIGDETGTIRIVLWNKQVDTFSSLHEGDVVKLCAGYVRENNARPELHLNDASKIIINPPGVVIGDVVQQQVQAPAKRKMIAHIEEADGVVDVLGTIVQVYDLRFYEVCPSCNKRLPAEKGGVCDAHGQVVPGFNYVLNCFLDDGSGNLRVVLFKDQVGQLLQKNHELLLSLRGNAVAIEEVKKAILGEMIGVVGKVNKNAVFDRLELVAFFVNPKPNPMEELARLDKTPSLDVVPVRKDPEKKAESSHQHIPPKTPALDDDFAALQQEIEDSLDR